MGEVGGDTGARDALHHSRATSESTWGKFGRWLPYRRAESPRTCEMQLVFVSSCHLRRGFSPSLGSLWASGLQGWAPRQTSTLTPGSIQYRDVLLLLTHLVSASCGCPVSCGALSHPPLT